MGWKETLSSIGSGSGDTVATLAFIIVGVIVGVLLLGVAIIWWWTKKRWNLKVEFKLVRSGGQLINAEWGKGYFNAKRGCVFVKRPGLRQRPVAVPIFDIRKYVQGDNIITVVQLSADDYRPVLNETWEEYEDDKTGEKAAMLNIKVDTGLNKAWKTAWDAAAKKAYSLSTFFQQFQVPIAIAIVIVAVFLGFAMIWTRLGSVCG